MAQASDLAPFDDRRGLARESVAARVDAGTRQPDAPTIRGGDLRRSCCCSSYAARYLLLSSHRWLPRRILGDFLRMITFAQIRHGTTWLTSSSSSASTPTCARSCSSRACCPPCCTSPKDRRCSSDRSRGYSIGSRRMTIARRRDKSPRWIADGISLRRWVVTGADERGGCMPTYPRDARAHALAPRLAPRHARAAGAEIASEISPEIVPRLHASRRRSCASRPTRSRHLWSTRPPRPR